MFLGRNESDSSDNVHPQLTGKLSFYVYPRPDSLDVVRYLPKTHNSHSLSMRDFPFVVFVGQLPHLLPLPHIAWALDLLLGDYGIVWVLQSHRNGCAKAWVASEQHLRRLMEYNGRLLFDIRGVWLAENEDKKAFLDSYVQSLRDAGNVGDVRVPRSAVNFEAPKNGRNLPA
jgi:hypothetical protein